MHEKRLVTFQMTPKRSRRQRSEKEATIADGWRKSKLSESAISSLVGRRLLRPRSVVQWFSAEGHDRPYERVAEIVMFKAFVERGLAIPVCDFLQGLLFFWGIQLLHLTPNSILHIAIFVHLCEAFLGIYPHFDLFKSLFFFNPYPNFRNVATVGVPILSFILIWRGDIFRILLAVRSVTGRPSGFILTIMHQRFLTEFLVRPSSVMSGSTMDILKFRKKNCCRGLLF